MRATRLRPLLLVAVLLVPAACRGIGSGAPERVLRVGTSDDYAPFSRAGEGFDVEVARLLAADLGARIEWVRFDWPELADAVAHDRFDLAMSGVTWRPSRALVGYLSRAVAAGGPCLLRSAPADGAPRRIAVNRGGILEPWTRANFPAASIEALDDNLALPARLASGAVDAIVTDSFEIASFRKPGQVQSCEPPLQRKVYWIAPAQADRLGPRVDALLRAHEPELQLLRTRWFGSPAPRDELDHLIDLLARRLELMPAVAAWKRAHASPFEDPAREAQVVERAVYEAARQGVDPAGARELFQLQIELAKAVQRRAGADAEPLELAPVRAALSSLGDRIIDSLAHELPIAAALLSPQRTAALAALLEPAELDRLRSALAAARRVPASR